MRAFFVDAAVYELGRLYRQQCLADDGSLLPPAARVHSLESLAALEALLGECEDGSGGFIPTLLSGLEAAADDVIRLAAEMLAFQLVGERDTSAAKKLEHVETVLACMHAPVALRGPVRAALESEGVARYGPARSRRGATFGFLLRAAQRIKSLTPDEREATLADPWRLRDVVSVERTVVNDIQANVLLHVMYPDTFSAAVSVTHRRMLIETFEAASGVSDAADDDRRLDLIQRLVSDQIGYELDFYEQPPLRAIWDRDHDRRAQEFIDWCTRLIVHPSFGGRERLAGWDREAEALAPAPRASTRDGRLATLRAALTRSPHARVPPSFERFVEWCAQRPDGAYWLLTDIWAEEPTEDAIDNFLSAVPESVAGEGGERVNLLSYLLLAVEPQYISPFDWELYSELKAVLGRRPVPVRDLDDPRPLSARVWDDWNMTTEELQLRLLARGLVRPGALALRELIEWVLRDDAPVDWPVGERDAFDAFRGRRSVSAPLVAAEVAPAAIAEPRVEPAVEAEPEPVVEVEPEPEPAVVPEPEPVVEPEPEPAVEAEPEPEPVVELEPEPAVVPEPEPVVEPEPVPLETAALADGAVGATRAPANGHDARVPARAQDTEAVPQGLPGATQELADGLLLPLDWLQDTVDLLREKRQLVFSGPSGSGKTYLARALGRHLAGEDDRFCLVQFHPSYTYDDFVEGYRPISGADQTGFWLAPGPLRQLADRARMSPDAPHVLLIDEIDRGDVASVFGELSFLLEYRNEAISLKYSPDEPFALPPNLYLLATAGTSGQSSSLDRTGLRRRFAFRTLTPTRRPIDGVLRAWLAHHGFSVEPADLLDELNRLIGDDDLSVGPSYLITDGKRPPNVDRVWETEILPLLEERLRDSGRDVRREFALTSLRARLRRYGRRLDTPRRVSQGI